MNARPVEHAIGASGKALFRADHVGSFLRPAYLLAARERARKGEISAAQLRATEDKAIAEVVRLQEDVGIHAITDGELRREDFHLDFLSQLGGVQTDEPGMVKGADGREHLSPPTIRVIDKVRHIKDVQLADF